jgi:hypothetical protein
MAAAKPKKNRRSRGLLHGARVYLSGPMDFVANRADEQKNGWRARIGNVLRDLGCVVFDPWNKPGVQGLHGFGKEGVDTDKDREKWTFKNSREGAETRAMLTGHYWETRTSTCAWSTRRLLVAYCPTSLYSVGTVHEIALPGSSASPCFSSARRSNFHLRRTQGSSRQRPPWHEVAGKAAKRAADQPNPKASPASGMPLVGSENFFDGFGFNGSKYRKKSAGRHEARRAGEKRPPKRPLLTAPS